MSESTTPTDQQGQQVSFDARVPPLDASLPQGTEEAEVLSPSPEQLVDLGDGSLTLDALVVARDALILQQEELTRRLGLYERAIKTWGEVGEAEPLVSSAASQSAAAAKDTTRTGSAPKLYPKLSPEVEAEPSMIVCMEALTALTPPAIGVSDAKARTAPRRREALAKTQRITTVRSPVSSRAMGMLAIGLALGGLTIWAGHSVSLASSGKAPATVASSLPVAIAKIEPPRVPTPSVEALPEVSPSDQVAELGISISHFDLVWGDTSVRRLRAALKRSVAKMRTCFEQQSRSVGSPPDTLELSLRLREDGSITWVKGLNDIGSSSAQSCVARVLHRGDFPASKSGLLLNAELSFKTR